MTQMIRRRTAIGLGSAAVLSWILSTAFSLVASPDYTLPVSLALACAAVHFAAVAALLRRGTSWLRFSWLLLALPLAILALDNLGRLVHALGGPLFRLLI